MTMIEPRLEEQLYHRLHRSNTIIKFCLFAILFINLITSIMIIMIVQSNQQALIDRSRNDHQLTRQHIQCVAEQLPYKTFDLQKYEACANK